MSEPDTLSAPGAAPVRLRDRMPMLGKARYLLWRAGVLPGCLSVKLRSGQTLVLRRNNASDLDIACQVFCAGEYQSPAGWSPRKPVRTVVDLGSNVGFTLVYFGSLYPEAEILAYEPSPRHIGQVRRNLAANGLTGRVTLRPVAVSDRACRAYLTDQDGGSRIVDQPVEGASAIEIVDWLDEALRLDRPIDLLKMDIEGQERCIIEDPRFEKLDIGSVVLEWHARPGDGIREAIERRLRGLGFRVFPAGSGYGSVPGLPWESMGILWADRPG